MFEKESVEYAQGMAMYYESAHGSIPSQFEKYLRKAVEFGYNKAKEDADKMKSQFFELCNLKDVRIAELEKANEWHKPSEKLPEECSLVLAYLFEETEPTICEYVVSNQWECLPKKIVFYSNDQVRLWKEIVLPKEIE